METRITNRIVDFICSDKAFKKHVHKQNWISGSSTVVYPVQIWFTQENPEIQIQWKNRNRRTAEPLLRRVEEAFPGKVKHFWFNKNDGSCPAEVVFIINETV